jgi:hypothetical protein
MKIKLAFHHMNIPYIMKAFMFCNNQILLTFSFFVWKIFEDNLSIIFIIKFIGFKKLNICFIIIQNRNSINFSENWKRKIEI